LLQVWSGRAWTQATGTAQEPSLVLFFPTTSMDRWARMKASADISSTKQPNSSHVPVSLAPSLAARVL